jgi:hypothetical protein
VPISAWLALVLLSPAPALSWQAPDECPDAGDVAALTASLQRRRPPLLDLTPDLPPRGVVSRASSGKWILQLELHTNGGRHDRRLQADECHHLARAAALVIAIHLDARSRDAAALREPTPITDNPQPAITPPAFTEPPAFTPPPAITPPAIIEPPRFTQPRSTSTRPTLAPPMPPRAPITLADDLPSPPPPRPEPSSQPRLAGHLRAEGGLDLGLLPGVGGSFGLAGGLALRGVRLEAGALAVPRRLTPPTDLGVRGRLDRLAAILRVCPGGRVRGGPVTLLGCLGSEFGAIRATATQGVADANPRWAPWFGLLLGPALRWRLAGPVGLWVAVEGVIALHRPRFTTGTGAEKLHEVTPVGLRMNLGVDLQFVARKR